MTTASLQSSYNVALIAVELLVSMPWGGGGGLPYKRDRGGRTPKRYGKILFCGLKCFSPLLKKYQF